MVRTMDLDLISVADRAWASSIATAAERFVLAHEYGHAVRDLSYPGTDFEASRTRERSADYFAACLIMTAASRSDSWTRVYESYLGAALMLAVQEIAEAYTDHRTSARSHPHMGRRLTFLGHLSLRIVRKESPRLVPALQAGAAMIDGPVRAIAERVHGARPTALAEPGKTYREATEELVLRLGERLATSPATHAEVLAQLKLLCCRHPSTVPMVLADVIDMRTTGPPEGAAQLERLQSELPAPMVAAIERERRSR
jgi:hypothetical protein